MKCPYQTRVIHRPEHREGNVIYFAEDITKFCECVKSKCPFYYTTEYNPATKITKYCRRVEREVRDGTPKI